MRLAMLIDYSEGAGAAMRGYLLPDDFEPPADWWRAAPMEIFAPGPPQTAEALAFLESQGGIVRTPEVGET